MSSGAESEVSGGPGEGVGGAVLAAVGRSTRRSGNGFLPEPVSPWTPGAGEGWPGLLVVLAVRVDPGMPAAGVPLAGAPPEGVSHVRKGS